MSGKLSRVHRYRFCALPPVRCMPMRYTPIASVIQAESSAPVLNDRMVIRPEPVPIRIVLSRTAETTGRWSGGIQRTFLPVNDTHWPPLSSEYEEFVPSWSENDAFENGTSAPTCFMPILRCELSNMDDRSLCGRFSII